MLHDLSSSGVPHSILIPLRVAMFNLGTEVLGSCRRAIENNSTDYSLVTDSNLVVINKLCYYLASAAFSEVHTAFEEVLRVDIATKLFIGLIFALLGILSLLVLCYCCRKLGRRVTREITCLRRPAVTGNSYRVTDYELSSDLDNRYKPHYRQPPMVDSRAGESIELSILPKERPLVRYLSDSLYVGPPDSVDEFKTSNLYCEPARDKV